mgnify:CR=1 FL=1
MSRVAMELGTSIRTWGRGLHLLRQTQQLPSKLGTCPTTPWRWRYKGLKKHKYQLIARPAILNHAELAAWQSSANNKANLEQWLDILASCDLRNLISQLTPALIWLNAKQDQLIPYPQQNQAAQILTSSSHLQLDRQQLNAKIAEFLWQHNSN